MKTLALVSLWCLAAAVAGLVLWRILRRKRIVLSRRWSPRLVQMVAVLVLFVTDGRGTAREALADGEAPGEQVGKADVELPVSRKAVATWRQRHAHPESVLSLFKAAFAPVEASGVAPTPAARKTLDKLVWILPRPLEDIVKADLGALAARQPRPSHGAKELTAALIAAEATGCFDAWLLGYVWRITGREAGSRDRRADKDLYARLARHARMLDALVRARSKASVTPFKPRAWMSKGGPSRKARDLERASVDRLYAAFGKQYGGLQTTTWDMDAFAEFGLASGSAKATLLRQAARVSLSPGDALFRLGRLDLLETPSAGKPVVLRHVWLGEIVLPTDRIVGVWDLPGLLGGDAQARVASAVADALAGDDAAAGRLEACLPLVHAELRTQLRAAPEAKGAARLRLLQVLFDERVGSPP